VTKPYALVVLWAVFAAAAVGVGFAAAGLVSAPFEQQTAGAGVPVGGPSISPSSSPPTADPGSASPSGSPSASPSPRATRSSSSQPRGITTRGGWVQGRCNGGLVTLSVSPAVGWELHERSTGANPTGTARFEETSGSGEVRVSASCVAGTPRFSVTEEASGGGDHPRGDDGGGHGGGSGRGGKG
jgi:hypothetical protein